MPFRPTKEAPAPAGARLFRLEVAAFRSEAERLYSERLLQILLDALTEIDVEYLRQYPKTPSLYKSGVVYTRQAPDTTEHWLDIWDALERRRADCLPEGTLLVKRGYQMVAIEDVQIGDEILDGDRWVKVLNWWDKGELPVLRFQLNNGCVLRCTADHRVFVVPKGPKGTSGRREDAIEMLAGDVKPGDDLLQPDTIPAGEEAMDLNFALLLGAYVADGCLEGPNGTSVYISGVPGGKGMREQCEEAAAVLGLSVRPGERRDGTGPGRGIFIHGSQELRMLAEQCGRRAPVKRFPTVNVTARTAERLLHGVNTDGTVQRHEGYASHQLFYSTSPQLVLQYRLLQRMLGRSVSIRADEEHSGFGSPLPLYFVGVRGNPKSRPWARVKSISLEEGEKRCYDIETESRRIYLPESDVVVHNCKTLAAWRAAEYRVRGIAARAFPSGKRMPNGSGVLYHVRTLLPDGTIEDPSRVLGMNTPWEGEATALRERGIPDWSSPKALERPGVEAVRVPGHNYVLPDGRELRAKDKVTRGAEDSTQTPPPLVGGDRGTGLRVGYSEAEVARNQAMGVGADPDLYGERVPFTEGTFAGVGRGHGGRGGRGGRRRGRGWGGWGPGYYLQPDLVEVVEEVEDSEDDVGAVPRGGGGGRPHGGGPPHGGGHPHGGGRPPSGGTARVQRARGSFSGTPRGGPLYFDPLVSIPPEFEEVYEDVDQQGDSGDVYDNSEVELGATLPDVIGPPYTAIDRLMPIYHPRNVVGANGWDVVMNADIYPANYPEGLHRWSLESGKTGWRLLGTVLRFKPSAGGTRKRYLLNEQTKALGVEDVTLDGSGNVTEMTWTDVGPYKPEHVAKLTALKAQGLLVTPSQSVAVGDAVDNAPGYIEPNYTSIDQPMQVSVEPGASFDSSAEVEIGGVVPRRRYALEARGLRALVDALRPFYAAEGASIDDVAEYILALSPIDVVGRVAKPYAIELVSAPRSEERDGWYVQYLAAPANRVRWGWVDGYVPRRFRDRGGLRVVLATGQVQSFAPGVMQVVDSAGNAETSGVPCCSGCTAGTGCAVSDVPDSPEAGVTTAQAIVGSLLVGGAAALAVFVFTRPAEPAFQGTVSMTGRPDPVAEAGRRTAMNVRARDAKRQRDVKRALAKRPRG